MRGTEASDKEERNLSRGMSRKGTGTRMGRKGTETRMGRKGTGTSENQIFCLMRMLTEVV